MTAQTAWSVRERTVAADAPTVAGTLAAAGALADAFADSAAARDAERELPHRQVRALKDSGLLALSVPVEHGGIEAPASVIAEVFRLLAGADPSLAQIPHSHYTLLAALRLQGSPAQQQLFYEKVLAGALFANAQSERGPHPIDVDTTVLVPTDSGAHRLSGRKYYCTGALFADWVIVRASLAEHREEQPTAATPKALAFIPSGTPGLTVVDDWDGMGQRTTASGSGSAPCRGSHPSVTKVPKAEDVRATGGTMMLASIEQCRLQRVVFDGVNLRDASFAGSTLHDVAFLGCDLAGADFREARLKDCRIGGGTLDGVVGVGSLRGVAMPWPDLVASAGALAAALGIEVADD